MFLIKPIFKNIFLLKLKYSNTDNKCFRNSKSTSKPNILDLDEVKQTVNTPTVIAMIVKRAKAKQRILLNFMHERNHLLSMLHVN